MNLVELDGKSKQELLTMAQDMGVENGLASLPRGRSFSE